ncbi:alpha/beta hydrolase [Halobacillus sp. K22]|uniref:alpha/beta hydrolase n=1 Tax=Halobacillus sp. K22 TaxID=3457431 RepID=UPI003FCDCDB5
MVNTIWKTYTARDFSHLHYVSFEEERPNNRAVILIHGITAELNHQKKFAESLNIEADVFLPILRGYDHLNPRGDLSYMEQFDDDLFDFIHFVKKKGYEQIVLVGHSMGCANLLRLIHRNPKTADHYLFVSPFFHPNLSVYRNDATDQFKPSTDVDYVVHEKKAGTLMVLYKLGVKRILNWTVAQIPDEFHHSGRLSLSFRLMMSRFLEKLPEDLFEGMGDRIRTYVGEYDEVVDPENLKDWYENTFGLNMRIIEDTDHNHILHDPAFHTSVGEWLKG